MKNRKNGYKMKCKCGENGWTQYHIVYQTWLDYHKCERNQDASQEGQ